MSDWAGVLGAIGKGVSTTARTSTELKELERRAQQDADRLQLSMDALELSEKRLEFMQDTETEAQAYRTRQAQATRLKAALDMEIGLVKDKRKTQDAKDLADVLYGREISMENLKSSNRMKEAKAKAALGGTGGVGGIGGKAPPDPNIMVNRDLTKKKKIRDMTNEIIGDEYGREYGEYLQAGGNVDDAGFPVANKGGSRGDRAAKELSFWAKSNPTARDSAQALGGLQKYFQDAASTPAAPAATSPFQSPQTTGPRKAGVFNPANYSSALAAPVVPVKLGPAETDMVKQLRAYLKANPKSDLDYTALQKKHQGLNWRAIQKALK